MRPSGTRNRLRANASGSSASSCSASMTCISHPSPCRDKRPVCEGLTGALNEGKRRLRSLGNDELELWKGDALLTHVFAGAVGVRHLAGLVALQEQELARALVRIDLCRQWRRV